MSRTAPADPTTTPTADELRAALADPATLFELAAVAPASAIVERLAVIARRDSLMGAYRLAVEAQTGADVHLAAGLASGRVKPYSDAYETAMDAAEVAQRRQRIATATLTAALKQLPTARHDERDLMVLLREQPDWLIERALDFTDVRLAARAVLMFTEWWHDAHLNVMKWTERPSELAPFNAAVDYWRDALWETPPRVPVDRAPLDGRAIALRALDRAPVGRVTKPD